MLRPYGARMELLVREVGRRSPAAVFEPTGGHSSGEGRRPGSGGQRPGFEVSSTEISGARVVSVRGDVDLFTAPTLARHLHEAALAGEPVLVIDLREAPFASARAIQVILRTRERLIAEGRALAIACRPEGEPAMVLAMLEIDQVIPVAASPSLALRALRAAD